MPDIDLVTYSRQAPAIRRAGEICSMSKEVEFNNSLLLDPSNQVSNLDQFARSLAYVSLQRPLTAIVQPVDRILGTDLEQKTNWISPAEPAAFGTSKFWAQQAGSAVGMLGTFWLASKLVRGLTRGGMTEKELSASLSDRGVLGLTMKEAAFTGFLHDFALVPCDKRDTRPLLLSRLHGGVNGAITMTALTASGMGLQKLGLKSEALAGALSAIPAGFVNANTDTLLRHHRFAKADEVIPSVSTMVVLGGAFGLSHQLRGKHESGRSNFSWSAEGKSFQVTGGEVALTRALGALERGEAGMVRVRPYAGPNSGVSGLFGLAKLGPERSLLLAHGQHGSQIPQRFLVEADLVATCHADPKLASKLVLDANVQFLRAGKDRISLAGVGQPVRPGERSPIRLGNELEPVIETATPERLERFPKEEISPELRKEMDRTECKTIKRLLRNINQFGREPDPLVVQMMRDHRVLCIGELHAIFDNPLVEWAPSLFPQLKAAGATHLATEVPYVKQSWFDHFNATGEGLGDPAMWWSENWGPVWKAARENGLKIVAVDADIKHGESNPFSDKYKPNRVDRDLHMATTIGGILEQSPDHKVVFYGGGFHMRRFNLPHESASCRQRLVEQNHTVSSVQGLYSIWDASRTPTIIKYTTGLREPVAIEMDHARNVAEFWYRATDPTMSRLKLKNWDSVIIFPSKATQ